MGPGFAGIAYTYALHPCEPVAIISKPQKEELATLLPELVVVDAGA